MTTATATAPAPSAEHLLGQYVEAIIAEEKYAAQLLQEKGLDALHAPDFAKLVATHLRGTHAEAYVTAYAVARALQDAFAAVTSHTTRVSFLSMESVTVAFYGEPSALAPHQEVLVDALKALTQDGLLRVYVSTQESSALITPASDAWVTAIF